MSDEKLLFAKFPISKHSSGYCKITNGTSITVSTMPMSFHAMPSSRRRSDNINNHRRVEEIQSK